MPVMVHMPIRLRVSSRALAESPAGIDAAFERAVARALGRSHAAVHQSFGDYLPPQFDAPTIRWSGAALVEVLPAVRTDIENRLTDTLGRLTRRAAATCDALSIAPLSEVPQEPYDPRRTYGIGHYRIDGYRDGNETAVALERSAQSAPRTAIRDWVHADVTDDYDPQFVRNVARSEATRQQTGLSRVYGLLLRSSVHGGWYLIVTADDFSGSRRLLLDFGRQIKRNPSGIVHGEMQYENIELTPPLTVGSMTEEALPADRADVVERLHALMAGGIGHDIRNSLNAEQQAADNLLTPDELDTLIAQEVERQINHMADSLRGRRFLLRLDWDDVHFNIGYDRSIAAMIGWDGTTPAPIVPSLRDAPAGHLDIGTGPQGGQATERSGAGGSADHSHTGQADDQGGAGRPGTGNRYGTYGGPGNGQGGRAIFPSLGGGTTMCCESFLGAEPPLSVLPDGGGVIKRLIDEIAERLQMVPCEFAATFCIGAAENLAGVAAAIAGVAGFDGKGTLSRPHGAGSQTAGNLGHAEFRPVASRGIQLLRRLSQAAACIAQLRSAIRSYYMNGPGRTLLGGEYAHNVTGWVLRFDEAVSPEMKQGVGEIFAQTCQLVMLQLLDTSFDQIEARRRNLQAYAPIFRDVMIRRLSDIGTLTNLRDRLRAHELAQGMERAFDSTGGMIVSAALPEWTRAAHALASACVATEGFAHLPGASQEIVMQDGVKRIRDAHGFMWTRAALEEAIAEQRGSAEAMDPLIQQLSDIPGTVELFRLNPDSAAPLLDNLLEQMSTLNRQKREEAAADLRFGLRVGRISEDAQASAVPGLPYNLAGVHQLAHEQIYTFFGTESAAYAEGVDFIFGVELGMQGLEHFFTFTGLVLLAVVCAPAAFVVGVGVAAHEVDVAQGRRDLYRSLINPELVLNRTEVELECYIAYVGLALSLLPEAGTAARAISVGVRGAARRGAMTGLRLATRSVIRHISRQVTEQLAQELLPAFVRELATNLLMEQIVPAVVGPVVEAVERELRVRMSVGGIAGAEQLIQQIEAEAIRRGGEPGVQGSNP